MKKTEQKKKKNLVDFGWEKKKDKNLLFFFSFVPNEMTHRWEGHESGQQHQQQKNRKYKKKKKKSKA